MKKFFLLFLIMIVFLTNGFAYASLTISNELIDLRSPNKKTYHLGEDNYKTVYFDRPVHYYKDGNYHEFEQELQTNITNDTYRTTDLYKTTLPKYLTKNNGIELSYMNEYAVKIHPNSPAKTIKQNIVNSTIQNSLLKKEISNKISYTGASTNLEYSLETSGLLETTYLQSKHANRNISYQIESSDLTPKIIDQELFLVDIHDVAIYTIKPYELIDSAGLTNNNTLISISQIEKNTYQISFELDHLWLDDENLIYPVMLLGSFTYTLNYDYSYIKDKSFVHDTSIVVDNNFIQVAKHKNMITDPDNPILLPEYHTYSIIELNLSDFANQDVVINSATLHLKQSSSSHNFSIPLSRITSNIIYENINGYSYYGKNHIETKSVSSNNLTYNIKSAVEAQLAHSTQKSKLLLELNPINIDLGASSFKQKSFISTNQRVLVNPTFEINYTMDMDTEYGSAPEYSKVSHMYINCFGYVLGLSATAEIYNYDGTKYLFEHSILNYEDFVHIIELVKMRIESYYNLPARRIYNEHSPISSSEYRIAFRIGNLANQNGILPKFKGDVTDEWNDSYHFMMQNKYGYWSEKLGSFNSQMFTSPGYQPSLSDWNLYLEDRDNTLYPEEIDYIVNFYDSPTVFFAVTKDWSS